MCNASGGESAVGWLELGIIATTAWGVGTSGCEFGPIGFAFGPEDAAFALGEGALGLVCLAAVESATAP